MWNAGDLEGGEYARIVRREPDARIFGQGESTHYRARANGNTVRVRWNVTVQVSSSVEEPGDDGPDVPLLHVNTAKALADNDQLEQVS